MWTIAQFWLDKWLTRRRESERIQDACFRTLIALHEHLLIVSNRLREFISIATPIARIPSFRLLTFSIAEAIPIVTDAVDDDGDIQYLLKTIEEHSHINYRWQNLEAFNDGLVRGQIPSGYHVLFNTDYANTVFAAKVIYNRNLRAMEIVEERIRLLRPIYKLKEGSTTEPSGYVIPE